MALAQWSDDGDLLLEAYHCRWSTAFFRGDIAVAAISAASASTPTTYLLGIVGELMLAAGEQDCAAALLDRALAADEEPDVGYYLAEIWRLRGHFLLALDRGNLNEARLALATAREVARRQGAVVFNFRGEASLAAICG